LGRKSSSLGKSGPEMKVTQLGLEKEVIKLLSKKTPVNKMERIFKERGIKITSQSIRKFIKWSKQKQTQLIKQDVGEMTEYKKMYMNYGKALNDILAEVEEVKNEARDEKDYKTYSALVGRLLQGIELFSKIAGDLKVGGTGDINIIFNEISKDVEKKQRKTIDDIFKDDIIDIDAVILEQKKEAENNE